MRLPYQQQNKVHNKQLFLRMKNKVYIAPYNKQKFQMILFKCTDLFGHCDQRSLNA